MFKGNNIVHEEEYHQGRYGWCGRKSKSYFGEVQGFWKRLGTQSVADNSSTQMSEITNHLRQTVSLIAPKSEKTSQHHLESLQSEIRIHSKGLCNAYIRTCISLSQASGIRTGSMQKGCGHGADVFLNFHGNLCRKTVKNFGTT